MKGSLSGWVFFSDQRLSVEVDLKPCVWRRTDPKSSRRQAETASLGNALRSQFFPFTELRLPILLGEHPALSTVTH